MTGFDFLLQSRGRMPASVERTCGLSARRTSRKPIPREAAWTRAVRPGGMAPLPFADRLQRRLPPDCRGALNWGAQKGDGQPSAASRAMRTHDRPATRSKRRANTPTCFSACHLDCPLADLPRARRERLGGTRCTPPVPPPFVQGFQTLSTRRAKRQIKKRESVNGQCSPVTAHLFQLSEPLIQIAGRSGRRGNPPTAAARLDGTAELSPRRPLGLRHTRVRRLVGRVGQVAESGRPPRRRGGPFAAAVLCHRVRRRRRTAAAGAVSEPAAQLGRRGSLSAAGRGTLTDDEPWRIFDPTPHLPAALQRRPIRRPVGTLLERALDSVERHKLGAHYTPLAYVERLVIPTVIQPLREG